MNSLKSRFNLKIQIPKEQSQLNQNIPEQKEPTKNSISKITENIFISGYLIGKNISYLKENNFTHVINCCMGSSSESNDLNEESLKQIYERNNIKYLSIYLRDDPEVDMLRAACAVYRMCLDKANGNFACALEMYNKGLDVWDQAMQECAANTGLTEAEIYASYTPDFVYANSSVAVENPNYYKEVLSYVSTNELYRLVLDDVDHIYGTYYRLERTESLDKAKVYQR